MAAPAMIKCRGLYTTSNRYAIPEGALVQATNILILKDGVIQPRWGIVSSSTTMTSGNVSLWHRAAQLNGTLWFGGRDTVANTLKIGYASTTFAGVTAVSFENSALDSPDGYANFTGTNTPYFDTEFLNVGNLLYANTYSGMLRFENSTTIRRAGNYPCAVSCFPRPLKTSLARSGSTTVTATTALAHGYVVGLKVTMTSAGDANFGAGEYAIVTVPSTTTFTYVDATSSGSTTLAAQTFAASNFVGSSGFMATNDQVEYRAVIVEYDSNGKQYVGGVSSPIVVENNSPFVGTANNKNVQLAILFSKLNNSFFLAGLSSNTKVELYRSRSINAAAPGDECRLVYSKFLSDADIANGFTWIVDTAPDSSAGFGAALYTNSTQTDLNQNHDRPAACKTAAVWKDRLVQANTFDFPSISMKLLSTDTGSGGLAGNDIISFAGYDPAATGPNSVLFAQFQAISSGSPFQGTGDFTRFSGGTTTSDIKRTVLSLLDSINWGGLLAGHSTTTLNPIGGLIGKYTAIGSDFPEFVVQMVAPDQLSKTSTTFLLRGAYAGSITTTRGCWAPKLAALPEDGTAVNGAAGSVTVTTTSATNFEVGENITIRDFTTRAVKTLGGVSLTGTITSVSAVTIVFTCAAVGVAVVGVTAFNTYIPHLETNQQKNGLRVSASGSGVSSSQMEAFPPENTITVGLPEFQILKCVPCKDSLMVFKEDGLFRVTASGAYGEQLSSELVDPNAILWAKDSAVAINGHVMAWLTKGVAIINEQGVQKYVSAQRIDDKLAPTTTATTTPDLLAYPYSRRAFAVVDEKHNLYELRACLSSGPSAPYASTVNLIYNTHNDTWVEDNLAVAAETFVNGKRYLTQGSTFYAQDDDITSGINTVATTVTAASVASGIVTGTYTGTAPTVGSFYAGAGGFASKSYILTGGAGAFTAYNPDGSFVSDFGGAGFNVYEPVICTIQWAPITFGENNKLKLFKQAHVLFGVRETLVAELNLSSELVTTAETLSCRMGNYTTSVGVNGFAPYNLRFIVPQQHRVGQQLNMKLVIRSAHGAWTIDGIGAEADVLGPRVNR